MVHGLRNPLRMALRFLRAARGRLVLTLGALASAVALVCALDLVHRAVLHGFIAVIETMAGRATLQVRVEESGAFPEALADAVGAVPGVRQVVAVVTATAFTTGPAPEALTVQAFDVTNADAARVYQPGDAPPPLVDDPLVFLNSRESVLVTREFAARHGLGLEDRLLLDTARGRQPFTVRGLLDGDGIARAYGGNLLVMDLHAAEAVFTAPGLINQLDIVTAPDADVATVARAVQAVLPAGLRVEAVAQRAADLQAVMRSMRVLLQGVGLVALGAAFLIAFTRLTAVFEERAWQLGILRALGVRRRRVWRTLLTESLLLGIASAAVGVPAGVLLGRLLLPLIATTLALNFRTVVPDGVFAVRPGALLLAAAVAVAAALGAALLPAWRASGVDAVQILRGRGIDPLPPTPFTWWPRLVLAVLAGAALLVQEHTGDPRAGLAATALLVALAAAAARPLATAATRLLVRLDLPRRRSIRRLALRALERHPQRTALAVAMVAIGIGTVLWLSLVATSFEHTAVRVFAEAMRADFVVGSTHTGAGTLELPVADDVLDVVRAVDGVAGVVGVRLANWQHAGQAIVLDAFDPDYFRSPRYGSWPLHGAHLPDAWEAVAAGRAIVVSSNFARHFATAVGDTVTLATPNGPLPVTVAGITTDFASPRGTIEMSRALYARYWNDPRLTRVFVAAAADAAPGLRDRLRARLAATGGAWRVITSGELIAYFAGQIRRAFSSLSVLAAIILLVVLVGIADTLGAGVVERTRELGTVRALGLRRGDVRRLVLGEALALTAYGLVLATLLGSAIALLWVRTTVPLLLGWIVDLHVPVGVVLGIVVTTAVSCTLAALLPARRAARLEPAAALRWE